MVCPKQSNLQVGDKVKIKLPVCVKKSQSKFTDVFIIHKVGKTSVLLNNGSWWNIFRIAKVNASIPKTSACSSSPDFASDSVILEKGMEPMSYPSHCYSSHVNVGNPSPSSSSFSLTTSKRQKLLPKKFKDFVLF